MAFMATTIVRLTNRGTSPGPRVLDGRTGDGSVALAPTSNDAFSGTRWRRRMAGDVWTLECLGTAKGPRFLDGHTKEGTVHLAPSTNPPFSGTRWRATRVAGGVPPAGLGPPPPPPVFGRGAPNRPRVP